MKPIDLIARAKFGEEESFVTKDGKVKVTIRRLRMDFRNWVVCAKSMSSRYEERRTFYRFEAAKAQYDFLKEKYGASKMILPEED